MEMQILLKQTQMMPLQRRLRSEIADEFHKVQVVSVEADSHDSKGKSRRSLRDAHHLYVDVWQ